MIVEMRAMTFFFNQAAYFLGILFFSLYLTTATAASSLL